MDLPGLRNTVGMQLDTAQATAGRGRLRQLADRAAEEGNSREGLVKAAKEFEGVFLNTLMKAMRKTVPDNKLFNTSGPTKFYQQMHVVGRSADFQRDATLSADDSAHVRIQLGFQFRRDQGNALLGGKHQVIQEVRVGSGHWCLLD